MGSILKQQISDTPIVFILGRVRSGTSLLQNLLKAHPSIIAPPETKFISLLYPRFGHIKKWGEKDILNFTDFLYRDPMFVNFWYLDKKIVTEELLSLGENVNYAALCKSIYFLKTKWQTGYCPYMR